MEKITEKYAIYNDDTMNVMKQLKDESVDLQFNSPPFSSMYVYSNDDRDLSNSANYEQFLEHYGFIVREQARILKKGRICAIHCMDIPNSTGKGLLEFTDDLIKIYKKNGFIYWDRKVIWKDPLMVAIRSRQQCLKHGQLVKDSLMTRGIIPDYVLVFKKKGDNEIPVTHRYGLTNYAGSKDLMNKKELETYEFLKSKYVDYEDDKTNKLSQFIWKRYADAVWNDIRPNKFLSYKKCKEEEDQRHLTPTSLDVIQRVIILYSNVGEVVQDSFLGVGSTVYEAVKLGRKGIGAELKQSYFRQAATNLFELEDVSKIKGSTNLFGESFE